MQVKCLNIRHKSLPLPFLHDNIRFSDDWIFRHLIKCAGISTSALWQHCTYPTENTQDPAKRDFRTRFD